MGPAPIGISTIHNVFLPPFLPSFLPSLYDFKTKGQSRKLYILRERESLALEMAMEALRPNLDLKPTHCTCTPTISTEFLRPTSLSLRSHRFSSLIINHQRSKRWSKLSCMLRHKSDPSISEEQQLIKSIGKGLFGFAAAAAALLSVCYDSPAFSESLTVAFPVSRAREVFISFCLWSFKLM